MIHLNSPEFGESFESYIFHELKIFAVYNQIDKLHYWYSVSGLKVDCILLDEAAIAVKASKNVSAHDLKNLKALREEKNLRII